MEIVQIVIISFEVVLTILETLRNGLGLFSFILIAVVVFQFVNKH